MDLIFHYDVVCPYAWMAAEAVAGLAARTGARVRWAPVLLGGIFRGIGQADVPAETWAPARAVLGHKDVLRQAALRELPLRWPAAHPRRTVDAMRLLVAAPAAVRPALSLAVFRAYWTEGRDVADREVLAALAREHGMDPAVIDAPETRQALFDATAAAVAAGAFGVPTFRVGDRLWWGADRMHLVEGALGGGRLAEPPPAGARGATLRFFHDFSSPFSYLASARVEAVAARQGATLAWTPILLGALFRDIGTPSVPMLAMPAPRQAWVARDLAENAALHGIPFRFPDCFPVRTVLPLRASIVEPRATPHLYRALWAEGRDIGQPDVVRGVLAESGLDAADILEQAGTPAVKQLLFDNTAAARAAGACGVPTFQLEDGMLIWGQDRMDLLERCLAGWRPPAEAV